MEKRDSTENRNSTEETTNTQEILRAYYRETNPEKRKALLEGLGEDDKELPLRKALFEARYPARRDGEGQYADRYLYAFMLMLQTRRETAGLFGRNRKQMLKTLALFGKEKAEAYGKAGEAVLHQEIVNAATRYFETCMSPGYRRKLFGTIMPSDEERNAHIRRDAYDISYGLAKRLDLEQETRFLCKPVAEAYRAFSDDEVALSQGAHVSGMEED